MSRFSILSQAEWLTAERVQHIAVVFAILSVMLLAGDAWLHSRNGVTDLGGEQLYRDFINYWSGAHLTAQGHAAQVYDIENFVKYERAHTAANAAFKWYSYPPITLILSLPLAMMGFIPALAFWMLSGVLVCAIPLARSLGWRMALLASVATPASLLNALSGQNGQFSAALLGGGIILLERRPWLAGILFGLLSFKPHLAVLIPVAIAVGGYWRAFTSATITMLSLICASVFFLGVPVWMSFFHNAPINVHLLEVGVGYWPRMPTPFAAIRLIGGSLTAAYGAQAISALAAAGLTAWVWRSNAAMDLKGTTLILATFLATPYAWDYDLVALTFAAAWFITGALREGFRPWEKGVFGLLIAMPLLILPVSKGLHLQPAPFFLWAALLIVVRRTLPTKPVPDKKMDYRLES
jgi:hypothetical protein